MNKKATHSLYKNSLRIFGRTEWSGKTRPSLLQALKSREEESHTEKRDGEKQVQHSRV